MSFTFEYDDPKNTVIYQADGKVLYNTETPMKLLGRSATRLSKAGSRDSGEVIGSIQYPAFGSSQAILAGKPIRTEKSSSFFSHSEIFTAADNKQYKWKLDTNRPYLVVSGDSKIVIATYTPKSSIFSSNKHLARLDVNPAGFPILDEIVLTFLYIEQKRRDRKRRSRNGAAAGAAASASAGGGGGGC